MSGKRASGAMVGLCLVVAVGVSGRAQELLVRPGDEFRYLKGRSEPPADWTAVEFDDSEWDAGPTGIGYADGDDMTILDDMLNSYVSVYMRRAFDVDDPTAFVTLDFRVDFDDGYVAYLNGKEFSRAGLVGNPPTFDTSASGHGASVDDGPGAIREESLPTSLLSAGTNVLAIQVHNAGLDSSDLSMIPELEAGTDPAVLCPSGLSCSMGADGVVISWTNHPAQAPSSLAVTRDGAPIQGSPFPAGTNRVVDPAGTDAPHAYAVTATFAAPFDGLKCPALECDFEPTTTTIFFSDDFESYQNDTELTDAGWRIVEVNNPIEVSAIWTVLNNGGRRNPPTEDGSPSAGRFLISDSDCCGGESDGQGTGRSHDIWSPAFSTAGAREVWLHFDCSAQLNNNGTVIFDVDVSIDDGGEWENVFRRIAPLRGVEPFPDRTNTDGYFGRVHVDLSDFVSGEEEVMVRWRQFEPDWDWWIAIDNVVVDDSSSVLGGSEILLETETFEDGIPNDWDLRSEAFPENEGPATWTTEDPCFRDASPGVTERGVNRQSPPFAMLDASDACQGTKDEYLVTPIIDCFETSEVFLHFKSETLANTGAIQEVLVSIDGGDSFDPQPIFSYDPQSLFDPEEDPFYAERVFSVPAAVREPEVVFAFHFQGSGDLGWWAIDDVKVTANPTKQSAGFVRGDANSDGSVNLTDGINVLNFLFLGEAAPACLDAGDFDDVGADQLTITDAIGIFNWLFLGAEDPPRPAPSVAQGYPSSDCGPDPTEDDMLGCASPPPACR